MHIMKLLIITQKVDINDDVLGFMHGWIKEFAKYCERLTVVCLHKGEYNLPENVKVLSLGKEDGESRLKYFFRFYKYIFREQKNYDNVFVHMNKEYVLLGGVLWKLMGKKIKLWYTHKCVSIYLRIAEKLVDTIFTASKESFRLGSKKLRIMGHGINTDIFKPGKNKTRKEKFKILTVGRISPIKDVKTLVRAIAELKDQNIELEIVGATSALEKGRYFKEVKDLVRKKGIVDKVNFVGSVPNRDILKYYQDADLVVNMAPTGGLDKVILEAMSCKIPVIVCNQTMKKYFGQYANRQIFEFGNHKQLAEKIKKIIELDQKELEDIKDGMREIVVKEHNLQNLIKNILIMY